MTPPPVETLSVAGMAFVAFYGLWEMKLGPALRKRRAHAKATAA